MLKILALMRQQNSSLKQMQDQLEYRSSTKIPNIKAAYYSSIQNPLSIAVVNTFELVQLLRYTKYEINTGNLFQEY